MDPGNKCRDDRKQAARKAALLQGLIRLLHPRRIDIHLPAHLAEFRLISAMQRPDGDRAYFFFLACLPLLLSCLVAN
jgi:hypothetical protein